MNVNVRIICISPPTQTEESIQTRFGMQTKSQDLLSGQPLADGSLQFECTLQLRKTAGGEAPDWTGAYVHGKPKQRFLYLSWGYKQDNHWEWIKRIKIPLAGVTWQQIDATNKNGGTLQATVDGTQAATVKLLGDGWSIHHDDLG